MANERLQGEEQYHSKNFGNVSFPWENGLENCTTKLSFVMPKDESKLYTLDCSCKCLCTFQHSYAQ